MLAWTWRKRMPYGYTPWFMYCGLRSTVRVLIWELPGNITDNKLAPAVLRCEPKHSSIGRNKCSTGVALRPVALEQIFCCYMFYPQNLEIKFARTYRYLSTFPMTPKVMDKLNEKFHEIHILYFALTWKRRTRHEADNDETSEIIINWNSFKAKSCISRSEWRTRFTVTQH